MFIDPVIDFEYAEEKEMAIFKNYTTKLFELSNSMRPYECSIYCQAPQGRASTHLIKVRKILISKFYYILSESTRLKNILKY